MSSTGYLLDTNILVHLIRGNSLATQLDQQCGLRSSLSRCMISVVTIGEMRSLARQFKWGQKKCEALQALLDEVVWVDINHPELISAYADIDEESRRTGHRMGKNDVWIAATAKVTRAQLLTTDQDFDHLTPSHLNLKRV